MKLIKYAICITLILILNYDLFACEPESYFLFKSEARTRLDSLLNNKNDSNLLDRIALLHNLAFHKDKESREKAELLIRKNYSNEKRPHIIKAYIGSLKMIKVSHRTSGSKIIRTINPLTKSPFAEAREGYRLISEASSLDPSNYTVRMLRATAAAESVEHLNELFDSLKIDLTWVEDHIQPNDSVAQFMLHLNWAKFYFKYAKKNHDKIDLKEAQKHIDLAIGLACTPVYREWALEWSNRIMILVKEESTN